MPSAYTLPNSRAGFACRVRAETVQYSEQHVWKYALEEIEVLTNDRGSINVLVSRRGSLRQRYIPKEMKCDFHSATGSLCVN